MAINTLVDLINWLGKPQVFFGPPADPPPPSLRCPALAVGSRAQEVLASAGTDIRTLFVLTVFLFTVFSIMAQVPLSPLPSLEPRTVLNGPLKNGF